MKLFLRYLKLWLLFAKYELTFQLSSKSSALFFFFGKMVRFASFLVILVLLKQNTHSLAGYSLDQIIIFFLTFNFIDVISQIFMRGVYTLSGKVRSGELDFYLAKPVNTLFRVLMGAPDFNDVLLLIPLTAFSVWYIARTLPLLTAAHVLLYVAFLLNGLLIAAAFHIFVVCVGILSTEVDNTIMLYRDLSQMGRLPMEIYREPLRGLVTFVVPVGMMMSVPARVLLGNISPVLMGVSVGIALSMFALALGFWKFALRSYTSASS